MSAPWLCHRIIGLPVWGPAPSQRILSRVNDPGGNAASWTVTVDEFEVADPAVAWTRAVFTVDSGGEADAVCRGGDIGLRSGEVAAVPAIHPNGVIAIDHVVLLSPDLGRTVGSLTAVGVNPRRERMSALGGRPIGRSSSGSGR
jgi:hypothetical protein